MTRRLVTIFGGSGFLGRAIVNRLAGNGWAVRVAVRHPSTAEFLLPMGEVGQISLVRADIGNPAAVAAAVAGADAVVNLVGILTESSRRTFQAIHADGAATIAAAAREAGITAFVQMSAVGASARSDAAYARSKAAGEEAVRAEIPGATILRPSVVFGPDDDFFNRFAKMAVLSPVLPVFTGDGFHVVWNGARPSLDLFGTGGPRFQPVYVGDVAAAVAAVLDDPTLAGRTYELGGPTVYSMKQIMELVLSYSGLHRRLLPLPMGLAMVQARVFEYLPTPPLTRDQVRMMRVNNILTGAEPGLGDLGITPTPAETILPHYLRRYGPPNRAEQ
ncbi:complex I NDUFA9 subunit family protein [Magnetospirillum fulvum]|uniref:NADH dehydrogenase n=1 Tax=Magnetospirillum fulvum TaxID=1082 RepID=A0A1H6IG12_MAGFU|nr:complex I NDUFA9 subunit family protein [Magnetospirillum fulvum]SEH45863.1 NADH dehydrogenase [Magnetospirillum fulvum]